MREHKPIRMASFAGAMVAACLTAAHARAQATSISMSRPGSSEHKPHNEQGRQAGDGWKAGTFGVAESFSLRMLAGGLGPCESAVGSGRNGFDTQIYVLRQATNQVIKLDAAGHKTVFADLSAVAPVGSCSVPTFDFQGGYGGSLYVQDPSVRTTNVGPQGKPTVFALNEAVDSVGTMKFDHAGSFGGSLYLTDSTDGLLYTVGQSGQMELVATGVGAGHSIAVSAGGAMGDAMFIGDTRTGRILVLNSDHIAGEPAQVFADMAVSAPGIKPAAMELSKYGPFGRGVLLVADTASGRIIQLNSQGQRIGELGTGFKKLVSVEIAWTGMFTGKLIVTANGCVYVVEPKCRGDWNGDRDITPADLADFVADYSAGDADFDGSGETDNQDIAAYFSVYSQGCP